MGNCRSTVISGIPDREVMIAVVDAIVAFEDSIKHGESLSRTEEKQKQRLEPVARALSKVHKKRVLTSN